LEVGAAWGVGGFSALNTAGGAALTAAGSALILSFGLSISLCLDSENNSFAITIF
jgi:hypothetical protein